MLQMLNVDLKKPYNLNEENLSDDEIVVKNSQIKPNGNMILPSLPRNEKNERNEKSKEKETQYLATTDDVIRSKVVSIRRKINK